MGLYYYGARYLDPKYSKWISTDPALGDYIPKPEADAGKLPGMGGIFNITNCNLYHYAGNNPIKYTDPDGREKVFSAVYQTDLERFIDIGCKVFQNMYNERGMSEFWNNVFDYAGKVADTKFAMDQLLKIGGMSLEKISKYIPYAGDAIDLFLGYISLASRFDKDKFKKEYDSFNEFLWILNINKDRFGENISNLRIEYTEEYTWKSQKIFGVSSCGCLIENEMWYMTDTIKAVCKYDIIMKDGTVTIPSAPITLVEQNYSLQKGDKMWKEAFGVHYFTNRFTRWIYNIEE